jgi:hypothetical protein
MRSKSTPEHLVGSLADRTPDTRGYPNVHHSKILRAELAGEFDLTEIMGRGAMADGENVQFGERKGVIYRESDEAKALHRWFNPNRIAAPRQDRRAWPGGPAEEMRAQRQ